MQNISETKSNYYTRFFYNQRQAEIGEKSSESWAAPRGWTFAIWKLFAFLVHDIIQKVRDFLKNVQKNACFNNDF